MNRFGGWLIGSGAGLLVGQAWYLLAPFVLVQPSADPFAGLFRGMLADVDDLAGIPQEHLVVRSAGGQDVPVRAEGQRRDERRVRGQAPELMGPVRVGDIPQAHGSIAGADREHRAGWVERDRVGGTHSLAEPGPFPWFAWIGGVPED